MQMLDEDVCCAALCFERRKISATLCCAADAAIEAMNGQFLMNRAITVSYAFKKDTKGERHGTPAERLLAAQKKAKQVASSRPNTLFATGAGTVQLQYGCSGGGRCGGSTSACMGAADAVRMQ